MRNLSPTGFSRTMRYLTAALVTLISVVLSIQTTTAQTPSTKSLSGAYDPFLQRAVDDWLDGKTLFPLIRLAALARKGNVAARLLLSSVGQRFYGRDEGLSARLARRLTRDSSGRGFGKSWLRDEAERGHPLAIVLSDETLPKDPDAWKAKVETLLAWGERQFAIMQIAFIPIVHDQHRHLVEVVEPFVTPNDLLQTTVWRQRWNAARVVKALQGSRRHREQIEAWSRKPRNEKVESDFRQAFDQGRLSAILFQWRLNLSAKSSRRPADYANYRYDPLDRMLIRWDLERMMKDAPPTLDQYRGAGGLLVAEAGRGGSLRPLYDLCRLNCSEEVALCMHAGVSLFGSPLSGRVMSGPRESLIPRNRWLESPRARMALLSSFRRRTRPDLGQSACFKAMMDPGTAVRFRAQ